MKQGMAGLVFLALTVMPALAAASAERIEGVTVEHVREDDSGRWLLSGTHLSRWAGLVKVGVSALWLPDGAPVADVLDARVGKQLEIRYLLPIPGERLRDGTREVMARNVPAARLAQEREALERIVNAFTDVRAGDRYTLTYRPGRGVSLARNGRVVAHTARDEAAAPLFAVWLGAQPLDAAQKRALLALRQVRGGSDAAAAAPRSVQ
jgi:hypothetical protein